MNICDQTANKLNYCSFFC